MDNFLIYCKLDTLKCTAEDIDARLETNAQGYMHVNDSLWLVKLESGYIGTYLRKEDYLMDVVLGEFVRPDSFIIIAPLNQAYWELPPDVHSFLQHDSDSYNR